jgi:hypothetical protein
MNWQARNHILDQPLQSDSSLQRLFLSAKQSVADFVHAAIHCVCPIRSGYDVVRVLIAVVLLTAAGLKCHELATTPIIAKTWLDSRWLLMATVEFELFFGLWLLANILPKLSWLAALGCFSLFTCISLYKALSGYASCGCFGRMQVNPWCTSGLDLGLVMSLLIWRPRGILQLHILAIVRPSTVLLAWLAIGLPAAYAMGSYTDTTLSDVGTIIGNGKVVVLKPEKWVGKRFPLLSYIDTGDKLRDGLWLVLLHKHRCPACCEVLAQCGPLASEFASRRGCPTIAVVECPPFSEEHRAGQESLMEFGRLQDTVDWHFSGPLCILLDNGQVRNVFQESRDIELLRAIWNVD